MGGVISGIPVRTLWAIAAAFFAIGELFTLGLLFLGPLAVAAVIAALVATVVAGAVADATALVLR